MTPEDSYQTPFDADESLAEEPGSEPAGASDDLSNEDQDELKASQAAWEDIVDSSANEPADAIEEEKLSELANPFVGMWNQLISTTNWEKGSI